MTYGIKQEKMIHKFKKGDVGREKNMFKMLNGKKDIKLIFLKNLLPYFSTTLKSQLIHYKIKRMLVEVEYVKNNKQKFNTLTSREKEIVLLIIKGNNNPTISKLLYISRYTVEQHRKNINRKLKIHSSLQLYAFAYAFNLI